MEEQDIERPWEELEKLVDELDPEQIEAFLNALPADASARAITRLSDDAIDRLLTVLGPECVFHGSLPSNPQESCHPVHGKAAT